MKVMVPRPRATHKLQGALIAATIARSWTKQVLKKHQQPDDVNNNPQNNSNVRQFGVRGSIFMIILTGVSVRRGLKMIPSHIMTLSNLDMRAQIKLRASISNTFHDCFYTKKEILLYFSAIILGISHKH